MKDEADPFLVCVCHLSLVVTLTTFSLGNDVSTPKKKDQPTLTEWLHVNLLCQIYQKKIYDKKKDGVRLAVITVVGC